MHRSGLWIRSAVGGVLLLGGALSIFAHDSPEHVVEALTARLHAEGGQPDLFWQRATEYRVLGRLAAAARDLQRALDLQPDFLPALTDLSRVQLAQRAHQSALSTINRALELAPEESQRAPLRMVRAEILAELGQWTKALEDCELALPHASGLEPDWYLTRSQIQCRLGQFRRAATGLLEGFERTGSAVLEVEAIDALIDGELYDAAAAKIGPMFEQSRWRSSWLIRRARVRLGQGEISAAHEDLLAAIAELGQRVHGAHPDAGLLTDRSLAYALAGDATLARRDLDQARKLGADPSAVRRIEGALNREP